MRIVDVDKAQHSFLYIIKICLKYYIPITICSFSFAWSRS